MSNSFQKWYTVIIRGGIYIEGKRILGTILGVVALIVAVSGLTFAWYSWQTTTQQNTGVTFSVIGITDCITEGTATNDATGNSALIPVSAKEKGYAKSIQLSSTCTIDTNASFALTLTTLPNALKDSAFKYEFVNGAGQTLASGNFATATQGDVITLATNQVLASSRSATFTLYLWIDGTEHSGVTPDVMQNQTYLFELAATVTNQPVA